MKSVHSHFNLLCVCVDVVKDCRQSLELIVQLIVELHGDSLATIHFYLNSVSLAVSLFAEVGGYFTREEMFMYGEEAFETRETKSLIL